MPLVISNFQRGQSSSPYTGDGAFAKSVNLDIFGQEGIARISYLPTTGSGTVGDLIRGFANSSGSGTTFYAVDDSNQVYVINPTVSPFTIGAIGTPVGKDVLHWKGWLLASSFSFLKYWTGGSWSNLAGSTTFSESIIFHPYLISKKDGRVYFCSGSKIDVLYENAGFTFNPGNGSTYTFTNAFNLPKEYIALGIAELNRYLVIAATPERTISSEDQNQVTIYFFWDRSSTTSDYIIEIPEGRMTNLLGVGGTIFVSGGDRGKIYTITESGLQLYAQIPFDFDDAKNVKVGGLGYPSIAWWNGMLLVGVSNDSVSGNYPIGIYGIKNKRICHLCLPSEGLDGSNKNIKIGGIYPFNETTFYFGWKNLTDNTKGINKVITSGDRWTGYNSYFETQLIQVGTKNSKKSFDKVEVNLARPLQAGEGVRIKYRRGINDSFEVLGTRDYDTEGAASSLSFPGIHNLENLQLRVELTTGLNSKNTPYVLSVICLP